MKTALKLITDENNLNIDFSQEWDGASLKGSRVGMIFRDNQWEYQGKTGFTAQPYTLISLANLREGNFTVPEPKYLSKPQSAPDYGYNGGGFGNGAPDLTDEDLPF